MLSLPIRSFVFKVFVPVIFTFLFLLGLSSSIKLNAENNIELVSVLESQNVNTNETFSPTESPKPKTPLEPFPFPFEEEKTAAVVEDSHFFAQFMKMIFLLGLLISIMFLASWSLKRMLNTRVQQLNVSSAIKVIESRSLSTKSAMYLIEVNDKTLLIGETAHSLSLLGEWKSEVDESEFILPEK